MAMDIDYKGRASRINEAIESGDAKQVKIAEYCNCSEQAVARWKTTGKISNENRYSLSEISRFRYLYLRNGELPKKFQSHDQNYQEYLDSGDARLPCFDTGSSRKSGDGVDELVTKIRIADRSKSLSPQSIKILSDLVSELTR